MTAITAIIHLGDIEKTSTTSGRLVGHQLVMEGLGGFIYVTPEVAAQWIPILTAIANEKSN